MRSSTADAWLNRSGWHAAGVGFAIVVSVIGRKYLLPYFIAGFFLVKYGGLGIMPLAIFGGIIAYLHILFTYKKDGEGRVNASA